MDDTKIIKCLIDCWWEDSFPMVFLEMALDRCIQDHVVTGLTDNDSMSGIHCQLKLFECVMLEEREGRLNASGGSWRDMDLLISIHIRVIPNFNVRRREKGIAKTRWGRMDTRTSGPGSWMGVDMCALDAWITIGLCAARVRAAKKAIRLTINNPGMVTKAQVDLSLVHLALVHFEGIALREFFTT